MRNKSSQNGADSALAKIPGGASGIPSPQGQIIPPVQANPFLGRGPGPKPKKYRVLNGGFVMFDNVRTVMKAGKEVNDVSYDIAALKKQGIKLELIVDEVEEEPEAAIEPAPPAPATAAV